MSHRSQRTFRSIPHHLRQFAIAGLLACSTTLSTAVIAAGAVQVQQHYQISAGPLDQALNQFADTLGLMLSVDARQTEGKHTEGLQGTYSLDDGLQRLLAGTGFIHQVKNGTLLLLPLTPADEAGVVHLQPINVAGRADYHADAPYQTAGSSHYLSEEKIQRIRGTSAGDIFKGTPGVLNGDNRGAGNALDVNIRGMQGMNRVPIVVDGSQQQSTVSRDYAGIAGRSYIDPDLIGGIDIHKGPTSGVEGVGAVGGVISMRTIAAQDIIRGDKSWGIRLRTGVSTNSSEPPAPRTRAGIRQGQTGRYLTACSSGLPANQCRMQVVPEIDDSDVSRPSTLSTEGGYGSLAVAGRSDWFELVGAYARRKTGNYHAGESGPNATRIETRAELEDNIRNHPGEWREYTWLESTQMTPYRAGEEVLNTSSDVTSWLIKATLRPTEAQSLELGVMNYQSDYGFVGAAQLIWDRSADQRAIQAPLSEVEVDTYTARYRWDPANDLIALRINGWRTETDLVERQYGIAIGSRPAALGESLYENTKWGLDVANTSELLLAATPLNLDYGLTYTRERLNEMRGLGRNGQRSEESAFLSASLTPLNWLKLDAATRYTRYHSKDLRDGYKGDDGGMAPMLAVTFMPAEGLQLWVRYAEALRMPALFEMTGLSAGGIAERSLDGNPDPEHANTWELGVNYSYAGLFSSGDIARIKLAYFKNKVKDYITRTNSTSSPSMWHLSNVDRADFRGYELSSEYIHPRWFTELSATYYTENKYCVKHPVPTIGKSCSDDGRGAGTDHFALNHLTPDISGSLALGVNFLEQKLELGGRVNYVGTRPDTRVGPFDISWPSYTITDMWISYKVSEQLRLDFNADNLTDRYYVDALNMGMVASPGRTLRAGFTWNL